MTKFAKLLALLLALVLVLSLAACKKDGEKSKEAPAPATGAPAPATDAPNAPSYLGVYKFESVGGMSFEEYMLSMVASEEDFMAQTGMTLAEAKEALTFNVNPDGTLVIKEIGADPTTGSWTANGNTVTFIVNGVSVNYTYDNGFLSGTNADGIFVVLKQVG